MATIDKRKGGKKEVTWKILRDWIKNNSTIRQDVEKTITTELELFYFLKDGKVLCRVLGYLKKQEILGIIHR